LFDAAELRLVEEPVRAGGSLLYLLQM
jgi:hypothetical protein